MLKYKYLMNQAVIKRNYLSQYIGEEYNEETKIKIETKFYPYKVTLCDIDYYYFENCLINIIRCVVENRKITHLCFN